MDYKGNKVVFNKKVRWVVQKAGQNPIEQLPLPGHQKNLHGKTKIGVRLCRSDTKILERTCEMTWTFSIDKHPNTEFTQQIKPWQSVHNRLYDSSDGNSLCIIEGSDKTDEIWYTGLSIKSFIDKQKWTHQRQAFTKLTKQQPQRRIALEFNQFSQICLEEIGFGFQ